MKKSDLIPAAFLLGLAIVLLGIFLRGGILKFKESERVVTVKGLSEREVAADKVIWPLVYKEVGDDLPGLYRTLESKNAKIVSFLVTNGIDAAEISVAPPNIIDLEAERYASPQIRYRYNATSVLTVSTDKVEAVRGLMARQGDLIAQGIAVTGGDYQYNIQYLYNGLNDIKPSMIEEATKNARMAAEKFASDSDSKLGKIKTASQGQFSISDVDASTPYRKTVRVVTTVQYYLKD